MQSAETNLGMKMNNLKKDVQNFKDWQSHMGDLFKDVQNMKKSKADAYLVTALK